MNKEYKNFLDIWEKGLEKRSITDETKKLNVDDYFILVSSHGKHITELVEFAGPNIIKEPVYIKLSEDYRIEGKTYGGVIRITGMIDIDIHLDSERKITYMTISGVMPKYLYEILHYTYCAYNNLEFDALGKPFTP